MLKMFQQTLKDTVSFEGKGLHSGKIAKVKILPAKSDQGIIFKRVDLKKDNIIYSNYNNVTSAKLCTTLENKNGVQVSTVEHLLAAFYVAEIDNAIVEINNAEVPIMDGSAKNFLHLLKKAGLMELEKKRKYLKILDKIEFVSGEKKISIEPHANFEVEFQLNYQNKIIGNQKNSVNFEKDDLCEITDSRTFCLFEDIEKIKKLGLAKGGSLENAIVVDRDKVLNDDGLRNEKEFVNHKILDLAGDFLLSGKRVLGRVKCYQGGHDLTNKFLKKIFKSQSSITLIEKQSVIITKKLSSEQQVKVAVNA